MVDKTGQIDAIFLASNFNFSFRYEYNKAQATSCSQNLHQESLNYLLNNVFLITIPISKTGELKPKNFLTSPAWWEF